MQTVESTNAVGFNDYEKERGKPMPNYSHGIVQANLTVSFGAQSGTQYRVANKLTFEFADGLTLTPDISVLVRRPVKWGREPARCREIPITVVEILSPSQGYQSTLEKSDAYFAHGVQSVWEVNPAPEIVAIYRPGEERPQIIQQGVAKDPATGLTAALEHIFA